MAEDLSLGQEDDGYGDGPMANQHQLNFAAFIQAGGRSKHPGLLPGPTSVTQPFQDSTVFRLREISRNSIRTFQEEFYANPTTLPQFDKGQILSTQQMVAGSLAVGMDPMHFSEPAAIQPPPRPRLRGDEPLISMGAWGHMPVISRGSSDQTVIRSRGFSGDLAVRSRGAAGDQPTDNSDRFDEDRAKFPTVPKRHGTLVDSLSVLSILNQPKPLTMADVDSLLARVGRKDPFAANAFGKSPPAIFLPATAEETRRVLNHELGVNLEFGGHDYARPMDLFERFHGQNKAPPLDAPRQKLVDALVGWGSAVAVAQKLSRDGAFSLEAPGGITLFNRSFRDEATGIVQSAGRIRASIGRAVSPYMLDLKEPVLDYFLPDGRGFAAEQHPFQKGVRDAVGFLLGFILPGSNFKDVDGAQWIPGGAGSSSTYQTINNLRKEMGGPASRLILTDDGQLRSVSVDPNPGPEGYTRGMFGFNPFGAELDRWSNIRGAQAAMVVKDPVLGPNSTLSNMQFWAGKIRDPYRGDSTFTFDPTFKFQGIETDPKTGKRTFKAPHVSLYQLDHVVPLSWAWQHGVQQLVEEAFDTFKDTTLALPGTVHKGLAALRGDQQIGSVVKFHTADNFDPSRLSPENQKVLDIMEAVASIGYAADPEQYALVSAALNQAKSDKGPGRWLPYGYAANAVQHKANLDYIRRWRKILSSSRSRFEAVLGPQPNLLVPGRADLLAMREVELGIDTYGRWTRPFGEAYVRYLDSPDLVEPGLYRKIRATQLAFNVGFSTQLALWSVVPWNRLYLIGREHLVSGLWNNLFPKGRATNFTLAPARDRFRGLARFYRDRYAGIPLLGTSQLASSGDDAIYTLHDLLRSGRLEETRFGGAVEAISRHGELLEPGQVASRASGRVLAATPSQLWRYFRGAPDAFGPASTRTARPHEAGRVLDLTDHTLSRYRSFLETGDKSLLGRQLDQLPASDHWLSELGRFEASADRLSPMRDPRIHHDLFAALREGAIAELSVSRTSQVGVRTLQSTSLFEEMGASLKARRYGEAAWYLARDLAVKAADYSARGLFGIGGGLGNLAPQRLAAILPMESIAGMASQFTGATTSVPLAYSPTKFPGGVFRWLQEQRSLQASSIDQVRQRLHGFEEELQRLDSPASRRRLARLEQQASLGRARHSEEAMAAMSREIEQVHALRDQLMASRRAARLDLARAVSRQAVFQRTLAEDGQWLLQAEAAPGLRGKLLRAAVEHPRLTAFGARVAARVPEKVATLAASPFVFHARVAAAIERNTIARRGFGALGVGLQVFGFAEAAVRYNRARSLAARPFDSLSDDEKAELHAYADRPTPLRGAWDAFLDMGGPLSIPVTPGQAIRFAPGVALAIANKLGRDLVRSSAIRGDGFHADDLRRLMQRAPSAESEAIFHRQLEARRAQGVLQRQLGEGSPFRQAADSVDMYRRIREAGAKGDYKPERIEREIRKARAAFQLVPLTDSLGYRVSQEAFGRESHAAFQQAPQFRSDRSLVQVAGRHDTLRVAVPDSMSRAEQQRRFAAEAAALRRADFLRDVARKDSFFARAMYLAASHLNPWIDRKYQAGQTDSAYVVRDAIQRGQLKPRHLESRRPK